MPEFYLRITGVEYSGYLLHQIQIKFKHPFLLDG